MKIYTSYYAQLRNLPESILPISIAGKAPAWYTGIEYKKLAPKYDWWKEWKDKGLSEEWYTEKYRQTVLSGISPAKIIEDLASLNPEGKDIALLCYEKPSDFCHRHLVADYLSDYAVKEWNKDDKK